MSHTCPDCGETCNCHGDIDDCEMNTDETYVDCVHGCKLTQLHDKHCRVRNDASIRPEYEKAYCTCKHRYVNTPNLVERTNREISKLKMVSPETARLLLAELASLRKAIEDVGLTYITNDDGNMVVLINCTPGFHARTFIGIKGAYVDHAEAQKAIDNLRNALEGK